MLDDWIKRITQPREELNGFAICPYAKGIDYEIIDTDGSDIDPPPWNFELIIYKLPIEYSVDEVCTIAEEYNKIYSDMIFLPDPKDRNTYINGIQTNNGKYNLILCQWRDNLNKTREKLKETSYYTHWNEDYLKEILST